MSYHPVDGKWGSALPIERWTYANYFDNAKKPSQIDDLVSAFSTNLDALSPQEHIQELRSIITANNYLTTTFKWSRNVNQQLKNMKSINIKTWLLMLREQNTAIIYYQYVYQQDYSYGNGLRRPWWQTDLSSLFTPHYHPASVDQSSSPWTDPYSFEIHALILTPRLTWYKENQSRKDADSDAKWSSSMGQMLLLPSYV